MNRTRTLFATILLLATTASDAKAWEGTTTHAGLTEQSALSSPLHSRLREHFGADRGLYKELTVPEADAPELFDILRRLNPTHGYVPDARGRMTALSWLVAGSVLADIPTSQAGNHFFDPRSGKGLGNATAGGAMEALRQSAYRIGSGASLATGGQSATSWWRSDRNPLSLEGFHDQLRKAVAAPTPSERDRHLAGALLAAGGMLHVLQDMGSPSHVRNDIAAHRQQIGNSKSDRGSRFERIAALAFGRLGIPEPADAPTISSLAAFFSNSEGTGLADITERSYFSGGTLPDATNVQRNAGASVLQARIQARLRRPEPSPPPRLDAVAARNRKGATWADERGVCLTRYQWELGKVRFWIDDDCALQQLEAILPQVGAYGVGFLDSLFTGGLHIESAASTLRLNINAGDVGSGTLHVFSDTADGTRSEYHSASIAKGSSAVDLPLPPKGCTRVTVLFDGHDPSGANMLATTSRSWPLSE